MEDDYEVTKKILGSGCSGHVLLGSSKINNNQKVAVKAIRVAGLEGDKLQQLMSEVEVFLSLDHPHVTRLFDVYETSEELYLVMECLAGGELFDRLEKRQKFSEQDAADAVQQMLLAVNYVHSHGIVHGDIKLENFLYDHDDSDHLKLIDFGFSKVLEPDMKRQTSFGTLGYAAPEVLERKLTSQSDLWSLGVTAFILLTGRMPFSGTTTVQMENIALGNFAMRKEIWKELSADAFDFVESLLQVDPHLRLTAQRALDHRWITGRLMSQRTEVPTGIAEALCQFGRFSKFRKSCLNALAWSLTNEERAKVCQFFIRMDTTQQGTITLAELKDVMINQFNISEHTTNVTFQALDSNGDQEIHYSDFLAAMVNTHIDIDKNLLKRAFERFDVDSSGFITVDNIHDITGDTFDIVMEADLVRDGGISFPEFAAYVLNKPLDMREQASYLQEVFSTPSGASVSRKTSRKTASSKNQPQCGCSLM